MGCDSVMRLDTIDFFMMCKPKEYGRPIRKNRDGYMIIYFLEPYRAYHINTCDKGYGPLVLSTEEDAKAYVNAHNDPTQSPELDYIQMPLRGIMEVFSVDTSVDGIYLLENCDIQDVAFVPLDRVRRRNNLPLPQAE